MAIVVIGLARSRKMPNQNQYKYRSLPTKSTVRLIKLERSKVEDRTACKIRYIEQSTAEYDALSYLWGDPTPTREILISNEDDHEWASFYVHENLWAFLDNAWQRKMFDRWIWTDHICLNQNDDEEKKEQIPRMADIYHNAVRVIAWLGLSVSQGKCLVRVCDNIKAGTVRNRYSKDEALAGFALYSADYWERVWVLQELVSAKEIVCFIGNLDMALHEVSMVQIELPRPELANGASTTGSGGALCFQAEARMRARASSAGSAPKLDLWQLLSLSTRMRFNSLQLKSQRPHDRVYGLLSLAEDFSDGTSPLSHIEVDYSKPPADAFFDVILESRPGWRSRSGYFVALDLLLKRPENTTIWEPVFTFLSRYTESARTSQRHRELAKLVLSVSDALYLLASISGSLPGHPWTCRAFGNLLSELDFYSHSKHTVQQDSAMFGAALALNIVDGELRRQMFEDWKACRHSKTVASSPWRCAAHWLPSERDIPQFLHIGGPRQHGEELEPLVTLDIEWHEAKKLEQDAGRKCLFYYSMELAWTLGLERPFEKVCGGFKDLQSLGACEGSLLLCEFPGANLRLQVSIHEGSDDLWRITRIYVLFARS